MSGRGEQRLLGWAGGFVFLVGVVWLVTTLVTDSTERDSTGAYLGAAGLVLVEVALLLASRRSGRSASE